MGRLFLALDVETLRQEPEGPRTLPPVVQPWPRTRERGRDPVTVALFTPDLQLPAHLSKPIPAGLVVWQDTTQQPPERKGVVWFPEVDQLVGNDVLNQGRWRGHVQYLPRILPLVRGPCPFVDDTPRAHREPGGNLQLVIGVFSPKALMYCPCPQL